MKYQLIWVLHWLKIMESKWLQQLHLFVTDYKNWGFINVK
jgi:hypothetical protein